jgi:hypothetical protein
MICVCIDKLLVRQNNLKRTYNKIKFKIFRDIKWKGNTGKEQKYNERFEVFTAVTMKNRVFWDVLLYFFAANVGC